MRNITGNIHSTEGLGFVFGGTPYAIGALGIHAQNRINVVPETIGIGGSLAYMVSFSAARVVPTADEVRGASISVLYCISY